jgi:hypothetical protein
VVDIGIGHHRNTSHAYADVEAYKVIFSVLKVSSPHLPSAAVVKLRNIPSRWTVALSEHHNDHEAIVTPDLYAVSLRGKSMSDVQS